MVCVTNTNSKQNLDQELLDEEEAAQSTVSRKIFSFRCSKANVSIIKEENIF